MLKRSYYLVVALVLMALGFFGSVVAVDEAGQGWQAGRPAVRTTAAALARKGPGGCAHVAVSDFTVPGDGYVWLARENTPGYTVQVPVAPPAPGGLAIPAKDIRIVLTTHVQDEAELINLLHQRVLEGLVISRGRAWNEHKWFREELAKLYPGLDTKQCWYLRVGDDKSPWGTALVMTIVGAGAFVVGLRIMLWCCGVTASRGVALGLLGVGAMAAGLVALYLWPQRDAMVPWERSLSLQAAVLVNLAIALPILGIWQLVQASPRRSQPWKVNDPDHITETEHGFVVTDRAGPREFRDEQVERIAVERNTVLVSNGGFMVQRRRLTLWVATDSGEEKVRLNEDLAPDGWDPKQSLIDRLVEVVYRKAVANFRAGKELAGEGWTCDGTRLFKDAARRDEAIPLADVVACERVLGSIEVWRRGNPRGVLSVKAESPNALVLARLLEDSIAAQPADAPATGHPLGRLLIEKNGTRAKVWILLVMAAAIIGILAWCGYMWLAVAVGLATPLCLWQAVRSGKNFFHFYDLGVHYRKGKQEVSFRYDQMSSLACTSLAMYQDGAYLGTHFNWRLTANVDGRPQTAKFHVIVDKDFSGWHRLRDRLSAALAETLAARLASEPYVEWTSDVWLGRDSLAYRPKGLRAQKDFVTTLYTDLTGSGFDAGAFCLWRADRKSAFVRIDASGENFWPGLMVLNRLCEVGREAREFAEPETVEEEESVASSESSARQAR